MSKHSNLMSLNVKHLNYTTLSRNGIRGGHELIVFDTHFGYNTDKDDNNKRFQTPSYPMPLNLKLSNKGLLYVQKNTTGNHLYYVDNKTRKYDLCGDNSIGYWHSFKDNNGVGYISNRNSDTRVVVISDDTFEPPLIASGNNLTQMKSHLFIGQNMGNAEEAAGCIQFYTPYNAVTNEKWTGASGATALIGTRRWGTQGLSGEMLFFIGDPSEILEEKTTNNTRLRVIAPEFRVDINSFACGGEQGIDALNDIGDQSSNTGFIVKYDNDGDRGFPYKVGIGTDNPSNTLHINTGSHQCDSFGGIDIYNTFGRGLCCNENTTFEGTGASINFYFHVRDPSGKTGEDKRGDIKCFADGETGGSRMEFATYRTSNSDNARVPQTILELDSSGNVDISKNLNVNNEITCNKLLVTDDIGVSGDLGVSGNCIIDGSLNVLGNFKVHGKRTIINTEIHTYKDPVIRLAEPSGGHLYFDSNEYIHGPRGIEFIYMVSERQECGFFGLNKNATKFIFKTGVEITENNNIIEGGSFGNVEFADASFNNVDISKNLKVGGDGKIYGKLEVIGDISCNAINATDISCNSIKATDISCNKNLTVGGYGKIYGKLEVIGDISCNAINATDISCNSIKATDISCNKNLTINGELIVYSHHTVMKNHYVNGDISCNAINATDISCNAINATDISCSALQIYPGAGDISGNASDDEYMNGHILSCKPSAGHGSIQWAPPPLPIGTILPFAGVFIPYGFLLCDGGTIPDNPYYYELVNTLQGPKVPDLRGRTIFGESHVNVSPRLAFGDVSGSAILSEGNLPVHSHDMSHNHVVPNHTHNIDYLNIQHSHDMAHTHTIPNSNDSAQGGLYFESTNSDDVLAPLTTNGISREETGLWPTAENLEAGPRSDGFTTEKDGSSNTGTAINTPTTTTKTGTTGVAKPFVPPCIVMRFIIKAFYSETDEWKEPSVQHAANSLRWQPQPSEPVGVVSNSNSNSNSTSTGSGV